MTNAEIQSKYHEINVFKNRGKNLEYSFIKCLYFSQVAEQSPKNNIVVVDDR